jgi:hypothetical protein
MPAAGLVLLAASAALALPSAGRPAGAQPPATDTPSPTAILPPPDISGDWSITRSWYRSCPGCGFVVTRTTSWRISQFGINVTVDKGLRGLIVGAVGGGGLLSLEGVESSGPDVYRFQYATLRVAPDGSSFEGGFNGSESTSNPCGEDPPVVSCFATNGYLTARRIGLGLPTASPPGPPVPTGLPSPFPLPSGTATPAASATPRATDTPPPSATPTASPSPSPSATPRPWWRALLPIVTWEP